MLRRQCHHEFAQQRAWLEKHAERGQLVSVLVVSFWRSMGSRSRQKRAAAIRHGFDRSLPVAARDDAAVADGLLQVLAPGCTCHFGSRCSIEVLLMVRVRAIVLAWRLVPMAQTVLVRLQAQRTPSWPRWAGRGAGVRELRGVFVKWAGAAPVTEDTDGCGQKLVVLARLIGPG